MVFWRRFGFGGSLWRWRPTSDAWPRGNHWSRQNRNCL